MNTTNKEINEKQRYFLAYLLLYFFIFGIIKLY